VEIVISDLKEIMNATAEIGLVLIPLRCELRVFGTCDPAKIETISNLFPGLKMLTFAECELLGAPITPETLPLASKANRKVIQRFVDRLPPVNSHIDMFLLNRILSPPPKPRLASTVLSNMDRTFPCIPYFTMAQYLSWANS
jgi:hypothetical protein